MAPEALRPTALLLAAVIQVPAAVAAQEFLICTNYSYISMRCWIQATSVLFLVTFLTSCDRIDFSGDRKNIIEIHLEKATKLYEQRDYVGAIAVYEDLLRKVPDDYEIHFKIAQIYYGNLNDYLNAAYHYQKYLNSPNPTAGQSELAKSFFENAKLQFAASVPNSGVQGSPELVKLRTENVALHSQVEQLKEEISTLRGKPLPPANQNPPPGVTIVTSNSPPQAVQSPPIPIIPTPTPAPVPVAPVKNDPPPVPAKPKTYVVKKGEGIQAIAEKVYGDRSKWRKIVSANPSIKDPDQLKPGQVLVLP
jgi:hypothetical protein